MRKRTGSAERTRYERSADRVDTRAGHYDRTLETKAGEVTLRVPKLQEQHTVEPAAVPQITRGPDDDHVLACAQDLSGHPDRRRS